MAGAAVGHALVVALVMVEATEEVPADDVSVFELHAERARAKDAAKATSATDGDTREEFTTATLQRGSMGRPVPLHFRRVASR